MSNDEDWALIAELLDELEKQMNRSSSKEVRAYHSFDLPFLLLYSRSRALYKASRLLINSKFPEEALGLGRSLFETSIELQQIAEDSHCRHEFSAWWFERDLKERKKIGSTLRWLKKEVLDDAIDPWEDEARKLESAIARNNLQKRRLRKVDRNLATKLGRESDYWLYELAHHMIHGYSQAPFTYRKKKISAEQGFSFALGMQTDESYPKGLAGIFIASSMVVSHEAATELIYAVGELPASCEFRARINRILHGEN